MLKVFKRAALIFVVGTACYAWVGFLLLPSLALKIGKEQLSNYANVPAYIHRIEFNPFSLKLDVWGVSLGEMDMPQASIQHLQANLELDSLWIGAAHLDAVSVQGVNLSVLFDKKGNLNLTQLFTLPESETSKTETNNDIFPVVINRFEIIDSRVRYADQQQKETVDVTFNKINLNLSQIDTRPDSDAPLSLSLVASDGTELEWQGSVTVNPLRSKGIINVNKVPLKSWWPYVAQAVELKLKKGKVGVTAQYEFSLHQALELKLKKAALTISPLALTDKNNLPLANFKQLAVSDASFNLTEQTVNIGKVAIDSLEAWADLDKNQQINWQKILPPAKAAKPKATTSDKTTPEKPWAVAIQSIALTNSGLHWKDASQSIPVSLNTSKMDIKLSNFDLAGTKPFELNVKSQIEEFGQLAAKGKIQLTPLTVDLNISTNNLDLTEAQAWITPVARVELRSATLDSNLALKLAMGKQLSASVSGDVTLNNLHTKDAINKRDLLKWDSVAVNNIDFVLDKHLKLGLITLNKPYVRFIINENLTTNVGELIIADKTASPAATSKPMPISIQGIQINNGSANFADFSLSQNFSTALQQLNGKIGSINNQQNTATSVNITGKVDAYAPVTIAGSLTPFDPLRKLAIETSFKNVELTTLTPYSGKFAGYRIRKGRLTLDLNYQIERGQLQAQNKVLLEQLQLGEKVESPDAVNLPIKLAVALLKDSKGQIDIDLPLRGNLEDPQFRVGPIIWQTVRNLLTRAVQAPFKFVSKIAGGGNQDLSQVAFTAGSVELNDEAKKALLTLSKGLQERPLLKLEIEGTSSPVLDAPILAQYRLQSTLRETYIQGLKERGKRLPDENKVIDFSTGERLDLLEILIQNNKLTFNPEWKQLSRSERVEAMEQALTTHWEKQPRYLRLLAQQRAAVIKQFLTEEGKIDSERLYLLDVSDTKQDEQQKVATVLHLGG
ncbi:DUF748 domain-containing protein [Pseudomonas sp. F1_0610]|uniref:DUF748 domain-containing protein n=1 Tax=Pseudomonas sp. F1_0610 TaxID=3114284 RepID=UPI0039C302F0